MGFIGDLVLQIVSGVVTLFVFLEIGKKKRTEIKKHEIHSTINMILMSLQYNQKTFFSDQERLRITLKKGGEDSLLKRQWLVENLDSLDYRKEFYYLTYTSSNSEFLEMFYSIKQNLDLVLGARKRISDFVEFVFAKKHHYSCGGADELDLRIIDKAYRDYIGFVDCYLVPSTKLIKILKEYTKKENIKITEIFDPVDQVEKS